MHSKFPNMGPIRNKIANFVYVPSITHEDDHFAKNCIKINFDTCWPLSVDFISETIKDGGNLLTFYRKLSAQ